MEVQHEFSRRISRPRLATDKRENRPKASKKEFGGFSWQANSS